MPVPSDYMDEEQRMKYHAEFMKKYLKAMKILKKSLKKKPKQKPNKHTIYE